MRQSIKTVTGTLFLAFGLVCVGPLSAQEHGAGPAAGVEAALEQRADETQSERSSLLQLLSRPEVEEVAQERGIDLDALRGHVETMSEGQIRGLQEYVQAVDESLAGGDRITIATSTVIIILLIVILVQVA